MRCCYQTAGGAPPVAQLGEQFVPDAGSLSASHIRVLVTSQAILSDSYWEKVRVCSVNGSALMFSHKEAF